VAPGHSSTSQLLRPLVEALFPCEARKAAALAAFSRGVLGGAGRSAWLGLQRGAVAEVLEGARLAAALQVRGSGGCEGYTSRAAEVWVWHGILWHGQPLPRSSPATPVWVP
jgi:hypothetical protein